MTKPLPSHAVEGLTRPGSGAVSAAAVSVTPAGGLTATNVQGALEDLDARSQAATERLVPLTTVVAGTPELVWDEHNNLVMTEAPR